MQQNKKKIKNSILFCALKKLECNVSHFFFWEWGTTFQYYHA